MLLPPLAMSESAMGVVVSPLNGLMDEQVTVVLCTDLSQCSSFVHVSYCDGSMT